MMFHADFAFTVFCYCVYNKCVFDLYSFSFIFYFYFSRQPAWCAIVFSGRLPHSIVCCSFRASLRTRPSSLFVAQLSSFVRCCVGDARDDGTGVPRLAAGISRLLEARDDAGCQRDSSDVWRQVGSHARRDGVQLYHQGDDRYEVTLHSYKLQTHQTRISRDNNIDFLLLFHCLGLEKSLTRFALM